MTLLRGDRPADLERCAQLLQAGDLVALPTETVYGLAARADDDAAVAAIFAAKQRPADHPLIVHVVDAHAAQAFAAELPPMAQRLMAALWPGPVAVVVRRRDGVAAGAAGGLPTVALRCPDHPAAQAVLRAARLLGVPGVAAPSANRFGRVSPTTAAHVVTEFGPDLAVLDGGPCREGIESTIVDCSRGAPYLLRPGTTPRSVIEAVLGEPLHDADEQAPRVSGSLESHYAPAARVTLVPGTQMPAALARLAHRGGGAVGVYSRSAVGEPGVPIVFRRMPDNPEAVAHELFAVLRQFDDDGVGQIWVEAPPDGPAWDGVRDRLLRAAAPR
jgi:L-threonylcarbamoyladenylate synthase